MSDLAEVQPGTRPWEPARGASLAVVLHRYDRPLIGTFDQHGTHYLFRCLAGEVERANFWSYVRVDPDQEAKLADVSAELFDEAIDEASQGPGVLAIAVDDRIVASALIDDLDIDLSPVISQLASRGLAILREEEAALQEVAAAV
ncbi:MAG TPA: hypothetical protein VNF71_10835 [Acidimicrobiales bacterium]|nr:hypothetical protein [Acidimicrobiales bacterium]